MGDILLDKNAPYLLTAYAVFLGALLLYFVSLRIRARNQARDEEIIRQIEQDRAGDGSGDRRQQ